MIFFEDLRMELLSINPGIAEQHIEIWFQNYTHSTLHKAEPLWAVLSEYCSTAQLIDVFVPLVGVLNHQLLVRLVCSLSVINVITSLIKWCFPTNRPYWFVKEFENTYNVGALPQHRLICETSAGFPSSHTMTFTAFICIVVMFSIALLQRRLKNVQGIEVYQYLLDQISFPVIYFISALMWLSRFYIGTQFMYQCMLSAIAANLLVFVFDRYSTILGTLDRTFSVLAVVCLGLVPVIIYFAMLRMDVDPHWSVRMAFKWCSDPSFLRHEASPVFVLARDFGYLMGVALSAPLYKRYEKQSNLLTKRSIFVFFIVWVNYYARLETPKQHGRFLFVTYEFTRNLVHSYTLLSILSKVM